MTISTRDVAIMTEQLGRPVRSALDVAARGADDEPLVVTTAPRLEDGTPFPTFYYLTHPGITQAVSRLEAVGRMQQLSEALLDDAELAAGYQRAHAAYIAAREAHGIVPEISGVSAGGMPTRVKCLHAVVAQSLAAGPGVNPIGDIVLDEIGWDAIAGAFRPDASHGHSRDDRDGRSDEGSDENRTAAE